MTERHFDDAARALTPELHQRFKSAIETGKWPDGSLVTEAQKAVCMEAVIAWEQVHLPEQERVGFIDRGKKSEGDLCADGDDTTGQEQSILTWKDS